MKKFTKRLVACAVAGGLAAPMAANATNGYFTHGFGMKHKGMAGAGVAYAQSAMSMATNPAHAASVGTRMDLGLDIFMPDRESKVGTVFPQNGDDTFYIPEFGYANMLDDKKAFGIAVYANGGLNTSVEAATGPYSATEPTYSNLAQLFIAPTFAMKLDDKNTIGVSVNLVFQQFEARGLSNFQGFKEDATGPATSASGDEGLAGQGKDHSFGLGFKFGWTHELNEDLTIGIAYQTETDTTKFDNYDQLFAESGKFDIPSTWSLGIAWKAMPKMNVAFDIMQINYSDIPALANNNCGFTTPHPGTCDLGDPGGPGFGWEDITIYKLGVDYQLNDNLVVRAGWNHGEQPIPESETAFNVLAPAVIEDHITLGATWTLQNNDELTVAYMNALENEVKGSGAPNTAGFGDLKMSQSSIGVAYGMKF